MARKTRKVAAEPLATEPLAGVVEALPGGQRPPGASTSEAGNVANTPPPSHGGAAAAAAAAPLVAASPAADAAALAAKAARVAAVLASLYPPPLAIPLTVNNHFELLVAVVLSAQCTDKAVNAVLPALFAAAPDPAAMAALGAENIKQHIAKLGLANNKAKFLATLSAQLLERHGGEVPASFVELEKLAGVGHKTASVVMSQAFGEPAFPVDTHIWRLAMRWGFSRPGSTVVAVERDLKALFPSAKWNLLHLRMIFFGREHCLAQRHEPATCPICSFAYVPGGEKSPGKPSAASAEKKRKSAAAADKD